MGMVKLEVQKERDTPLLCRKRVVLTAEYSGSTPSRLQFRKEIANKLSANESLVVVRHIYTRFGKQKCKLIAHVYSDEKNMRLYEDGSILKKHSPKKEDSRGESAEKKEEKTEAKKEEKPAKKEDKKPEAKKE